MVSWLISGEALPVYLLHQLYGPNMHGKSAEAFGCFSTCCIPLAKPLVEKHVMNKSVLTIVTFIISSSKVTVALGILKFKKTHVLRLHTLVTLLWPSAQDSVFLLSIVWQHHFSPILIV